MPYCSMFLSLVAQFDTCFDAQMMENMVERLRSKPPGEMGPQTRTQNGNVLQVVLVVFSGGDRLTGKQMEKLMNFGQ